MVDAERYLDSLEPLGMRFGLERIQRLLGALGDPQRSFDSVHVVGTNGKTSVTEITAALLEAHGSRSGAYVSPHLEHWRERVLIGGDVIDQGSFAAAVAAVARAIEEVEEALEKDDVVTQFEAATAAAFVALAEAGVRVAAIEAGLGGRLDATNVLASKATVLTSIGLEHTQWLGETELEIAAEKLAVLREGTVLVLGEVSPEVAALARETAAGRGAEVIRGDEGDVPESLVRAAPYLQRNFAVACAAARVMVGELDEERVARVAADLDLHGRFEVVAAETPMVLDAAHNPDGALALAEALPQVAAGRPVFAVVALLADKDAREFFRALAPVVEGVVATEVSAERLAHGGRPGARSHTAADVALAASESGIAQVETVDSAAAAVARVRALASEHAGVALVTGSHYLLTYVAV